MLFLPLVLILWHADHSPIHVQILGLLACGGLLVLM